MTNKIIDWLNSNRFRAYPFVNDSGIVIAGSRIPDAVVLDCMVMDTRKGVADPRLTFTGITITKEKTVVTFSYDGIHTEYSFSGGESSGDLSFHKVKGRITTDIPENFVDITLVFSSHRYLLDNVGEGIWNFSGLIIPTKIISVTASGVSGIVTNGSKTVQGPGTAIGNVHLVDGYRTQPVIQNGRVLVKVGTKYGYDPCHYPNQERDDKINCEDLMLFFCGQNAISSGNINIKGGPGVNISQGRMYTAKNDIYDTYGKVGIKAGESVPCIEISAAPELLRIYTPSDSSSGN